MFLHNTKREAPPHMESIPQSLMEMDVEKYIPNTFSQFQADTLIVLGSEIKRGCKYWSRYKL